MKIPEWGQITLAIIVGTVALGALIIVYSMIAMIKYG